MIIPFLVLSSVVVVAGIVRLYVADMIQSRPPKRITCTIVNYIRF